MRKNDSCIAVFGGQKFRAGQGMFYRAKLLALFGGVTCDLTETTIAPEATIRACAIFGGIVIRVPDNVSVKVRSCSLFGGISNLRKTPSENTSPTLYIHSFNLFGGTDIL